ncbi:hypothetical protein BGZ54_006793, partial [Gamsiella multidivaricata]
MTRLVQAHHKTLLQIFTQGSATILHFDGPPTTQKAKAREKRRIKSSKDVEAMNDQANKIQEMVGSDSTNLFSRIRKRKLVQSIQKVKGSWAVAKLVYSTIKTGLTAGLKE